MGGIWDRCWNEGAVKEEPTYCFGRKQEPIGPTRFFVYKRKMKRIDDFYRDVLDMGVEPIQTPGYPPDPKEGDHFIVCLSGPNDTSQYFGYMVEEFRRGEWHIVHMTSQDFPAPVKFRIHNCVEGDALNIK